MNSEINDIIELLGCTATVCNDELPVSMKGKVAMVFDDEGIMLMINKHALGDKIMTQLDTVKEGCYSDGISISCLPHYTFFSLAVMNAIRDDNMGQLIADYLMSSIDNKKRKNEA